MTAVSKIASIFIGVRGATMNRILAAAFVLTQLAFTSQGIAESIARAPTDNAIKDQIIRECRDLYHRTTDPCACPHDRAKDGRSCRGHSAYELPGGATPFCFRNDVSPSDIARNRANVRSIIVRRCTTRTNQLARRIPTVAKCGLIHCG